MPMRQYGRLRVPVLVLAFLVGSVASPGIAAAPASNKAVSAGPFALALDEKMPGLLSKYDVPGAVVAYIQDGAVAWTKAYGVADDRTGRPLRPEAVFNFASAAKALTAWGVMRLVETGKIELDAPADRYLKRWHLPPSEFDPNEVTVRRLLSHTAGLTVSGYAGYDPRRRPLPSLKQVLEGQNQISGAVRVAWKPGDGYHYSGGGYTILQMVIEDVTGESYTDYIRREVLVPLGLSGGWEWTSARLSAAPTPYGFRHDALPYYRFVTLGIGNYLDRVDGFARFVAAAGPGPGGEPAGRGVLRPETLLLMMTPQPGTNKYYGLGCATEAFDDGTPYITHGGHSSGWCSIYALAPSLHSGFVVAAASDKAEPLKLSVLKLWAEAALGRHVTLDPKWLEPTTEDPFRFFIAPALILAGVLGVIVALTAWRLMAQVSAGRRRLKLRPGATSLAAIVLWLFAGALWLYFFYSSLPFPLPPTVPEASWPRELAWTTAAFMACALVSIVRAFFPKSKPAKS
jgi:CubicO group peptidase (beta-lactamase class C family)